MTVEDQKRVSELQNPDYEGSMVYETGAMRDNGDAYVQNVDCNKEIPRGGDRV